MKTLYLQRIEISNFRAYGDNFSLSLPGPGVTILTGPEGLGKSAFFDAMEWALTGRVRRLEALTQESLVQGRNHGLLARREEGVPVARYGVSLEFVNDEGKRTLLERRAVREQGKLEQFAEISSPSQQQMIDLQAVLEVDERRRGAELKRETLLRLGAACLKIAQGVTQKSSAAAQVDRHTHELWMIQSYLQDTTKTIQRIKDLDNRIRSLLLVKHELESRQHADDEGGKEDEELRSKKLERLQLELEAAQAARNQLPNLEYLNEYQAGINERIDQLSSAIQEAHEVVARLEEELLAAHALLQQHPAFKLAERESELQQWPALLLDDPLQPQDLIHVEAVIEVLRNLVQERSYQVILSIHDEELADSLRRKLEVAGLPCVTCRYRGLHPTGVLYSAV